MTETNANMGFPTEIVKEGNVKIVVPKLKAFTKSPSEYAPSKAPVFYNPVMELNRDLAVLALQAHQRIANREISVCEPLTGCGIRGIRFATEVEGVKKVLISDINRNAFQLAKHNVQMNRLSDCITVENIDANLLLANYGAPHKRFDAIDIDPFGSPVPYMDSAIRALRNEGLLALTATDIAPLCGVHPKACIRKYGGKPLRTEYCHELAVRLLAGSLATAAAKQDIGINIVFSHSTDHYIRVYASIKYGAKKADESIKNMGYVKHCFKCFHREIVKKLFPAWTVEKCGECNSRLDLAGPLWLGEIFHEEFFSLMRTGVKQKMFKNAKRVNRMLASVEGEIGGPATYYVIDKLCDMLNLPAPPVKKVIEAVKNGGFQAFLTHFNSRGIRSDTSATRMKEILRETVGNNR